MAQPASERVIPSQASSGRCPRLNAALALAWLFAAPAAIAQPANTEIIKRIASDGGAFDEFGVLTRMDGDRMIVGAWLDDDAAFNAGALYVFQRQSPAGWTEVAKLTADDGAQQDTMGLAADISGDVIIVGARGHDGGGSNAGAAYVFERQSDGAWMQTARLTASDARANATFGECVAVEGSRAVIGARFDAAVAPGAGAVYVFERNDQGQWEEAAKLTASDAGVSHQLGFSCALEGDRVIAGALAAPTGQDAIATGAVYVFERQPAGAWSQAAKLEPPTGQAGDEFGACVEMEGDRIVVGVRRGDLAGQNSGAAHVYERDHTGAWTHAASLIGSDTQPFDEFGRSVQVQGDIIVVGAWLHDALGMDAGAAYVFHRDASGWRQVDKLLPSDGAPTDELGKSLDIQGELVLIGSPYDDDNGERSGSAYFFDLTVGDFNRDGGVGPPDLLLLLASWGAQGDPDITGDGVVGAADLMRLISLWGRRYPVPEG